MPHLSDLAAFLEAAGAESRARSETRPRPLMEAQQLELQTRWALYNNCAAPSGYREEAGPPQPGDLVANKQGHDWFRPGFQAAHALILWRLLDPGDAADRALIKQAYKRIQRSDHVDCIVAFIDDDGDLMFAPNDIRRFRRLDASEIATLESPPRGESPDSDVADQPIGEPAAAPAGEPTPAT